MLCFLAAIHLQGDIRDNASVFTLETREMKLPNPQGSLRGKREEVQFEGFPSKAMLASRQKNHRG